MLSKLSKQPEQGRRVKFALADDLRAAYDESEQAVRMTTEQIDAAYELVANLIGQIPNPDTFYEDIEGPKARLVAAMTKAMVAAEELGIDPSEALDSYADAEEMLESLKDAEVKISEYFDEIEPILKLGGF